MVIPARGAVNSDRRGAAGEWIVLALGSNLGDRERYLGFARSRLAACGLRLELLSPVAETEPLGGPAGQPRFLNQVVAQPRAGVGLSPHELLRACLRIEAEAGRVRAERWGPRTLDIDILLE